MKRVAASLREILSKVDIVTKPAGKSNSHYLNQMNNIINQVHANKIVAIWTRDVTKTLTEVHRFGPSRYFSQPLGGQYYYIIRYGACCLLSHSPNSRFQVDF